MYFKDAQAVIFAFAMDNANSFYNLDSWLTKVEDETQGDYVKIIVGNKSDKLNKEVPY